jgi:hypothetical protein
MSRALCLLLAVAAVLMLGCEGTVIIVDDEGTSAGATGPLYCPQEDDGCPLGDGVPSPVIVEIDAGADGHEAVVIDPARPEP